MEVRYTAAKDDRSLEGATIEYVEMVEGWTRIFLTDGRAIVIPDCECLAIVLVKDLYH